jgi:hypothetical protein
MSVTITLLSVIHTMLLFTQGSELSVTKKGRYTEGRQLSVPTAPTSVCGEEHYVRDHNVTIHTMKGFIGD